jgi:SAM-dependent methyltransferase
MSRPSTYDPRRFKTTVPYYARYRLNYPDTLIMRVAEIAGLQPGDSVLDLGCGPALIAIAFARIGMRVTAVDPEPGMLDAAANAAREAGVALDIKQGSSFDMPRGIGPFKLVTIGRAFHWMDGAETLALLDTLVTPEGSLAFFDEDHPRTIENAWWSLLFDIGKKYGGNQSAHILRAQRPDFRTHHSLLLDSAFPRLEGTSTFVRRQLSAEEIVGLAFSLSISSRGWLGERADAFEADLRAALTELSPGERFTEIAELRALVAKRG